MSKLAKHSIMCLLIMLASTATLMALSPNVYAAHGEVTAIILNSVGGTVSPAAGTYTYVQDERTTLTATPEDGFKFKEWVIQGIYETGRIPPGFVPYNVDPADPSYDPPLFSVPDNGFQSFVTSTNPLTFVSGSDYTIIFQAIFEPTTTPPSTTVPILIVLAANGGTSNPGPGTYSYAEDTIVPLTATPSSGFEFQYWVVSGGPHGDTTNLIIMDNPLDTHSVVGEAYTYQPVFTPVGSDGTGGGGGIAVEYLYAIIVVLAIIAVIGIALALMYMSRSKSPPK